MNKRVFSTSILCLLFVPASVSAADWPEWRGPTHNGMAMGDAPLNWSDSENIKWRAAIPGRGHSSPVVWGDKVFLTTAIPTAAAPVGELRRPGGPGPGPGGGPPSHPQAEHEFALLCLDRSTGRILWQRTVVTAVPHQGYRPGEGTFANESPVTDGRHVIAYFGSRGIFCYDLSGNLVWKKELGIQLNIFHEYGEGTSPVLDVNMLLIKADHEGPSFLLALNKNTGEQLWRVTRDERTSFSVPLVVTYQGRKQIITSATKRIRAYDYETGALIWECGGLGMNAIPAPISANGVVYAMTGYQDPVLMAIRLGGQGDITGSDLVLWSTTRNTAYVPSPLLHQNRLYVVRDGGFISAYDATTGSPVYQQIRLPVGHTFKSSPVGVNGKIYLASEQDDVMVLKMGDKPDVLTVNTLKDQVFVASPAIVDGEIFLRGSSTLFCISGRMPATGVKPTAGNYTGPARSTDVVTHTETTPVKPTVPAGAQDTNKVAGRPGMSGPRLPASPIIAALDLDGDGVIDANEIAKAPKSLKKLDKNGDGKLTPDEYRPQRPGRPGGSNGPGDLY